MSITPLSIVLFIQSVLLAISQLDFVSLDVQRIIVVLLIVVNAALLYFFNGSGEKAQAVKAQLLGKK